MEASRPALALAVCAAVALLAPQSVGAATALEPVGTYSQPVYVTSDPDDPDRLFVVEKAGTIKLTVAGVASTFLDQTPITSSTGEQGLLSMAFAPDFAATRRFYVFYTDAPDGSLRVDELIAGGDVADPDSRRHVLTIPHPDRTNHNGGQLQFGPDGHLYVSTGDGGGPENRKNAQDLGSLLGKLLRIDPRPTGSQPYSVPPDNPFVESAGADEIWSWGLRNPWRFSFDRETGALTIGDVGQNRWEEIDYRPQDVGGGRGDNFGWHCFEGSEPFVDAPEDCEVPDHIPPVFEYANDADNCAITGGYVVRDPSLTDLYGRYLYADLCAGELRSVVLDLPLAHDDRFEGLSMSQPTSFGEDACGRLYVASLGGAVSRLVGESEPDCEDAPPEPPPPEDPPAEPPPPEDPPAEEAPPEDPPAGAAPPEAEVPPNNFRFVRVNRLRRKGRARVVVRVPAAGTVRLLGTKRVRRGGPKTVGRPRRVRLLVRSKGQARRKLNRVSRSRGRARVRVRARVRFIPSGGEPRVKSRPVTLIKRR